MGHPWDDISVDDLRAAGSLKWTRYPGETGAWVAESDLGTAPAVTDALHAAVDTSLLGYLPDHLLRRMSEATAGRLAQHHGWTVDPERIRALADVISAVRVAIEHFSDPGGAVIVPTPAYMPFLVVPQSLGRRVIEVPLVPDGGRWVYDLDALGAAFAASDAGRPLLLLCNPHNPVGRVLERGELTAVSEVVDRHGARVLADEIHAPLVFSGHRHLSYAALSPTASDHTVTAVSASKAWNLPGLKCAQLVLSNDADAARWAEVGELAEHGASTVGVLANAVAYEDGGPWLSGLLAYLDGNRRRLAELVADLPGVRMTEVEGTYLALLDCRDLALPGSPADFFAEHAGVRMVDGAECGLAGAGFVRYNFATPRPVLEASLAAMAATLDGAPRSG